MEPMIDYRLTEIQVVQARFRALRLLAYTSTVFPTRALFSQGSGAHGGTRCLFQI